MGELKKQIDSLSELTGNVLREIDRESKKYSESPERFNFQMNALLNITLNQIARVSVERERDENESETDVFYDLVDMFMDKIKINAISEKSGLLMKAKIIIKDDDCKKENS